MAQPVDEVGVAVDAVAADVVGLRGDVDGVAVVHRGGLGGGRRGERDGGESDAEGGAGSVHLGVPWVGEAEPSRRAG